MEKFLAEDRALKQGAGPVDFNDAAVTGNRVSIADAERVAFVVSLGAGTSTSAHTFVLKQHDADNAGNSHDLSTDNPYYHKVGAADKFTKVEVSVATATHDLHSLLGDSASMVVFEVLAEQLRPDCKWVSLNASDSGGAQLGSVLAVVKSKSKPGYDQEV